VESLQKGREMKDKILLVDDDAMVLAGLKRQLRNQFNIETALSGEEALKMVAEKGPYAVVISDFLMPGMNGIEFLCRLKANNPETVRMMLTGSDDMPIAIGAVNKGNIFQFHSKPCSADILGEAIKAGIEEYRKISANNSQLDKVKVSLAHASEIQRNLMPKSDPEVDGFDIAGKCIWCDETGGDYYDFIDSRDLGRGKFGIVVSDVSGHGISSALLMATARAFIRELIHSQRSPAPVISEVNKRLSRDIGESGMFMTMFYSEIDTEENCIRWARAGHEPAILYDPDTNCFEDLSGQGVPLGVWKDSAYEESKKRVNPGQVILIGTDGIKETCNSKGEMFGKNRLKNIMRDHAQKSAKEIVAVLVDAIEDFRFPMEMEDDVTAVIIKVDN
jgi:serine phosphatase RsbU (regulator of sigma subunit)